MPDGSWRISKRQPCTRCSPQFVKIIECSRPVCVPPLPSFFTLFYQPCSGSDHGIIMLFQTEQGNEVCILISFCLLLYSHYFNCFFSLHCGRCYGCEVIKEHSVGGSE
ncbi:hypothetical protein TRVL_00600 [Trypanosoma vivax]|nr:hypothetical protein TRVL_00600 [Trypanosoma vivax]